MLKLKHALIAALAIPAIALAAAACDDDADSSSSVTQESLDETNARVQRNEMIWATNAMEQLPVHDVNEALTDLEANVPSDAIPTMRALARIISVTNWDETLRADAEAIADHALATIAAIEENDREAAAEHSTEAHDGYHDFTVKAWEHLAPGTSAGDDHGGGTSQDGDDGDDHGGDETPAADATAEDGDDHGEDSGDGTPTPGATP